MEHEEDEALLAADFEAQREMEAEREMPMEAVTSEAEVGGVAICSGSGGDVPMAAPNSFECAICRFLGRAGPCPRCRATRIDTPLPRTRVLNAPCDIWTRSEPCFFAPGPKRAILSLFPPSGTLYHFLSLCPQHVWGAKSRSVKWPQIRGFAITGAWPACADACRRSSALGRSCCSCSNCGRGSSTLRTAEDQRQTYGTRAPSWHA